MPDNKVKKQSPEWIAKRVAIRKANGSYKPSFEALEKMRISHLGQPGFWKGKKRHNSVSEERKKELAGIMKGNQFTKGMKFPNRKRTQKHSMETREKISKAFKGDKHPLWRGGGLRYWILEAKRRDNYTCQICGNNDPDVLEVDHIVAKAVNPSLKKELSNMVTLCANCHKKKTLRERHDKLY